MYKVEERGLLPLSQVNLIVTAVNWTTQYAIGSVYRLLNGEYGLKFGIMGTVTSAVRTEFTVNIAGITIAATQAIQTMHSLSTPTSGVAFTTNSLRSHHSSATTTYYVYSGDIALSSKPDWVE